LRPVLDRRRATLSALGIGEICEHGVQIPRNTSSGLGKRADTTASFCGPPKNRDAVAATDTSGKGRGV